MTYRVTKWFSAVDSNPTVKKQISHLFLVCSLSLLCLFSPNVLADGQKDDHGQRLNLNELLDTVGQDTLKTATLVLASKADRTILHFRCPSMVIHNLQIEHGEDIDVIASYILIHGVVDSQRIDVLSGDHKLFQKAISQLENVGKRIHKETDEEETTFVIANGQDGKAEVCITSEMNGGWVAELRKPSKVNTKDKGVGKGKSKKNSIEEVFGIPVLLDLKANEVARFLKRRKWSPFSIHQNDYELYVNGNHAIFDSLSMDSFGDQSRKKWTVVSLKLETAPKISNELQAVYQEVIETVKSKLVPETVSQQREDGSKGSFCIHLKGFWLRSAQEWDFIANLNWYQSPTAKYFYFNVDPEMFGKRNHSQEKNHVPARKTKAKIDSLHTPTTRMSTVPATIPSDVNEKFWQGWPIKGITKRVGESCSLHWFPTSIVEYQNIVLQFSSDGGKTWATVASKLKPGQNIEWTVPKVTSKNCLLRIAGLNAKGKSVSLETSDPFGVDTEE